MVFLRRNIMAQVFVISKASHARNLQPSDNRRLAVRTPVQAFCAPQEKRCIVHCFRERGETPSQIARKLANPGTPGPVPAVIVNGVLDVLRDEWDAESGQYRVSLAQAHEEIKTLMRVLAKYGIEPEPPSPVVIRRAA
jgi:hypothetical protein